jgi:hypothetical protein
MEQRGEVEVRKGSEETNCEIESVVDGLEVERWRQKSRPDSA